MLPTLLPNLVLRLKKMPQVFAKFILSLEELEVRGRTRIDKFSDIDGSLEERGSCRMLYDTFYIELRVMLSWVVIGGSSRVLS